MNNTDISKVYLLSVPLENDYKHSLYFTSKAEQQTYFSSKIVKSYSNNFSYQRKDHVIYIPDHYDNIYNVNYVMYQNSKYNNKWFYAFVKNIKYENDECTIVEIETDVIQTWLFDYTIKPSFVEREHVSDDAIGLHTIPEGLETGEYVSCLAPTKINTYESETYICIAVSEIIEEVTLGSDEEKKKYNGVYSGLYYVVCLTPEYTTNLLKIYDKKGKADSIYSVFLIPKEFIYNTNELMTFYIGQAEEINYTFGLLKPSNAEVNLLRDSNGTTVEYKEVVINNQLDESYRPRNNKLFTSPYNYMILTNNVGGDVALKYEDFKNNPRFKVVGAITPGCSIKCVPIGYKTINESTDINDSYNYGLVGGKFPICSWSSDAYTNWLTQNGVNVGLGIGGSLLTVAGGVGLLATGGGAFAGGGMIASGVMGVLNSLGQVYQQSFTPDQAKGNTNSGDVTYSTGNLVFTLYQMSIKREYAEIIDKYFDMFGYKVNMVKTPNKAHRSRYWYTKTIDINIDGSIPMDDMERIKNAYNSGITFWRNASEIQNYNLSNDIVE